MEKNGRRREGSREKEGRDVGKKRKGVQREEEWEKERRGGGEWWESGGGVGRKYYFQAFMTINNYTILLSRLFKSSKCLHPSPSSTIFQSV